MKGRFVDPLSPYLRAEGNVQARFSQRKSIGFPNPYRLTSSFFALRKYFDTHFWGQCVASCPGLYGGLYGQNLPYKFKKSYGDLQNRNFEEPYKTTGPRSDLRPDSWSWPNSGLETTFGIIICGYYELFASVLV